jgi:hypothetical protein
MSIQTDFFGQAVRVRKPQRVSAVAADLHYDAFALGDIGPEVRDELVRRPWLTAKEKLELIGDLAMPESEGDPESEYEYSEDDLDDARDKARAEARREVLRLLPGESANDDEVRAALDAIRAEVA